jgi:FixJ family two-component response regulator
MQSPTVFVVADDPAVLNVLVELLKQAKLQGEIFPTAEAFLAKFNPERPGCLVLDMSVPGMGGVGLHRVLVQQQAVIPVIILTSHSDAPGAMKVLKGGAFDYFEKPLNGTTLLGVIRHALEMERTTRDSLRFRADVLQRFSRLTKREKEIMDSMLESKSSREIAVQLNMSARTVEFHRARIMKKMGVVSLVELVRMIATACGCHCIHKHRYLQGIVPFHAIFSPCLDNPVS